MSSYIIAGSADRPETGMCEQIANVIKSNYKNIDFRIIIKHPNEWDDYIHEILRIYGFKKMYDPIIFTLDGKLIGGIDGLKELAYSGFGIDVENIQSIISPEINMKIVDKEVAIKQKQQKGKKTLQEKISLCLKQKLQDGIIECIEGYYQPFIDNGLLFYVKKEQKLCPQIMINEQEKVNAEKETIQREILDLEQLRQNDFQEVIETQEDEHNKDDNKSKQGDLTNRSADKNANNKQPTKDNIPTEQPSKQEIEQQGSKENIENQNDSQQNINQEGEGEQNQEEQDQEKTEEQLQQEQEQKTLLQEQMEKRQKEIDSLLQQESELDSQIKELQEDIIEEAQIDNKAFYYRINDKIIKSFKDDYYIAFHPEPLLDGQMILFENSLKPKSESTTQSQVDAQELEQVRQDIEQQIQIKEEKERQKQIEIEMKKKLEQQQKEKLKQIKKGLQNQDNNNNQNAESQSQQQESNQQEEIQSEQQQQQNQEEQQQQEVVEEQQQEQNEQQQEDIDQQQEQQQQEQLDQKSQSVFEDDGIYIVDWSKAVKNRKLKKGSKLKKNLDIKKQQLSLQRNQVEQIKIEDQQNTTTNNENKEGEQQQQVLEDQQQKTEQQQKKQFKSKLNRDICELDKPLSFYDWQKIKKLLDKIDCVITLQILPFGHKNHLPVSNNVINIYLRDFLIRSNKNQGIIDVLEDYNVNQQMPEVENLPFEKYILDLQGQPGKSRKIGEFVQIPSLEYDHMIYIFNDQEEESRTPGNMKSQFKKMVQSVYSEQDQMKYGMNMVITRKFMMFVPLRGAYGEFDGKPLYLNPISYLGYIHIPIITKIWPRTAYQVENDADKLNFLKILNNQIK